MWTNTNKKITWIMSNARQPIWWIIQITQTHTSKLKFRPSPSDIETTVKRRFAVLRILAYTAVAFLVTLQCSAARTTKHDNNELAGNTNVKMFIDSHETYTEIWVICISWCRWFFFVFWRLLRNIQNCIRFRWKNNSQVKNPCISLRRCGAHQWRSFYIHYWDWDLTYAYAF